jgi:hypothetical protein
MEKGRYDKYCPDCGQKLIKLPELAGRYRFHDDYLGCEYCDIYYELLSTGDLRKAYGQFSHTLGRKKEKRKATRITASKRTTG